MLVQIFEEAGLPPGVLNIVHGGGSVVGERLITHPDVKVVTFTGSKETGIHVATQGAATLKRIHLELGGKNAIIVMDDADLDNAADGILWSAFGTSGQRCTAASRVIVHERVYDALARGWWRAPRSCASATASTPQTDVGPLINQAALDKVHRYTGDRPRRGSDDPHRRRALLRRQRRLLLLPDDLRRRGARHAGGDRGDLRPGHSADPLSAT